MKKRQWDNIYEKPKGFHFPHEYANLRDGMKAVGYMPNRSEVPLVRAGDKGGKWIHADPSNTSEAHPIFIKVENGEIKH